MPEISVIVPVFNREQYIPRCFDSILLQTFMDFELLIIDDGSTDGSGAICEDYALKDMRVRTFHKSNGGVASARNEGIRNAKGRYLVFVDSDDYIMPDYLKSLLPVDDEDFVMDSSDLRSPCLSDGRYEGLEMIKVALFGWQILCPWGKLYKSDIVKGNGLYFDERCHIGEDILFNLEYLSYLLSMRTLSTHQYKYTDDNPDSLSICYRTHVKEALFRMNRVYSIGKQLSEKFQDTSVEVAISKYAGITWALWGSLRLYKFGEQRRYIKNIFSSDELSDLMKNYLECEESGRRFAIFYLLCRCRLYGLAAFSILR